MDLGMEMDVYETRSKYEPEDDRRDVRMKHREEFKIRLEWQSAVNCLFQCVCKKPSPIVI